MRALLQDLLILTGPLYEEGLEGPYRYCCSWCLIFEYISEHIFKPYFTQLTWLCLDVCDVGFISRSQVLLWNMNSKLVPSIGPDAPEAVSVLRQIRDRKLIHFICVRSVSNGLSGQFGWDGPSARQRHMHRLKKNILHLARRYRFRARWLSRHVVYSGLENMSGTFFFYANRVFVVLAVTAPVAEAREL